MEKYRVWDVEQSWNVVGTMRINRAAFKGLKRRAVDRNKSGLGLGPQAPQESTDAQGNPSHVDTGWSPHQRQRRGTLEAPGESDERQKKGGAQKHDTELRDRGWQVLPRGFAPE